MGRADLIADDEVRVIVASGAELRARVTSTRIVEQGEACDLQLLEQVAGPSFVEAGEARESKRLRTPEGRDVLLTLVGDLTAGPANGRSELRAQLRDVSVGGCALFVPRPVPTGLHASAAAEISFELCSEVGELRLLGARVYTRINGPDSVVLGFRWITGRENDVKVTATQRPSSAPCSCCSCSWLVTSGRRTTRSTAAM